MPLKNGVKNRDEYLRLFTDEKLNLNSRKTKQAEALKHALDIRKFEIDLYWKRAAYFWAFIAVSFAGYFALVSKKQEPSDLKSLIIVSILGFIFSYSWYFVNRGSKFWQNNWERHVDYLEDEIIGPLYKTVTNSHNCKFFNPIGEYPFSVSKINQLTSLLISFIWLVLMYDPIQTITDMEPIKIIIFEFIFASFITGIYGYFGRSKTHTDNGEKEDKFITRDL